MRTVGTLLKEERLRKNLTLEQVEKATKIRAKFLEAIETDSYKSMPALPYIQGFIKNYSTFLGLRATTILAIFRRQYIQKEKERSSHIEEPLTGNSWQITPNKVLFVVVIIIVMLICAYFYGQFKSLHAPPPLLLEEPKEDMVSRDDEIAVYGNTDADATLTINNEPVLVKEDGKFYKDIVLSSGLNTLVIEATSRVGEKTTITRKITRAP